MKSFLRILMVGVPLGLAFELLPLGWAVGMVFLLLLYFAWDLSKNMAMLILFTVTANATTYYVDFSTGSDAANGTSTSTPWKHLPGDPAATGNANSIVINGDAINVKGGVTYSLTVSAILVNSTHYNAANGATIVSGDLNGWGTGRAVITGINVSSQWMITSVNSVTLRGLEFTSSWNGGNNGALQLELNTTTSNNVVDSCWIHDAGTNIAGAHQDCVEVDGTYNVITNCHIWNATQKCLELFTTGNGANIVANNIMWNASDHVLVLSSDNNIVYGNFISNAAPSPIVGQQVSQDPGAGIKIVGRGFGNSPSSNTNLVYNNVIYHNNCGIILEDSGTGDMLGNKIFNNTIINNGLNQSSPSGVIQFSTTSSGRINTTQIRNNIIYEVVNVGGFGFIGIRILSPGTPGQNNIISHNLWAVPSGSMIPMVFISGANQTPTFANFADNGSVSPDYRFAATGTGNSFGSSANQIFNSDPVFESYPGDLRLLTTSPAKSAGTNLSTFFTTDILGITRSFWSMGAYEFEPFPPLVNNVNVIFTGKKTASGKVLMQ